MFIGSKGIAEAFSEKQTNKLQNSTRYASLVIIFLPWKGRKYHVATNFFDSGQVRFQPVHVGQSYGGGGLIGEICRQLSLV
jgi:hypothetical protein